MTLETARPLDRLRWRVGETPDHGLRAVAEETPVAIVHDASTTAVMMATPADLEDFAVGFSLSEGIVAGLEDIRSLDVAEGEFGVELRLWLAPDCAVRLASRRRRIVGPTGCGLCGVESLEQAAAPPRRVIEDDFTVGADDLLAAMTALEAAQPLGRATRAVHAAALWAQGADLLVREDVGRHNALDKLVGAAARTRRPFPGVVLLTSRVSVEMVQKTAALGAPVLCAVSAPTALAVRVAEAANITLVAVTRSDGFEVFTHGRRVRLPR